MSTIAAIKAGVRRRRARGELKWLLAPAYAARSLYRRAMIGLWYKQIVEEVRRAGPEADVERLMDQGLGGFHGLVASIQNRQELAEYLRILQAERPRRAMEVGTAGGGTLYLLARVIDPKGRLISLDLPGGPGGGGYPDWKIPLYQAFALPGQDLELVRGDSHSQGVAERARTWLAGEPLDALFIDGDHSYEGVKQDFEVYGPMVRPGGLIALHDIEYCEGVRRFWAELKAGHPGARELLGTEGQVYGIGLVRG